MPSMRRAFENGGPVKVEAGPTLAEGIAVGRIGQRCYDICKDLVEAVVPVSDDEIARTILSLLEREKDVAEGAGAAAVAALLYGRVPDIAGRNVVAVVTGGNIDVTLISRIIERGLVESGRMARLEIMISDRPGALAALLTRVAEAKANVMELRHERAFFSGGVANVQVELKVETRGADHLSALVDALEKAGFAPRRM
jgi:threonine dehydratase